MTSSLSGSLMQLQVLRNNGWIPLLHAVYFPVLSSSTIDLDLKLSLNIAAIRSYRQKCSEMQSQSIYRMVEIFDGGKF